MRYLIEDQKEDRILTTQNHNPQDAKQEKQAMARICDVPHIDYLRNTKAFIEEYRFQIYDAFIYR